MVRFCENGKFVVVDEERLSGAAEFGAGGGGRKSININNFLMLECLLKFSLRKLRPEVGLRGKKAELKAVCRCVSISSRL